MANNIVSSWRTSALARAAWGGMLLISPHRVLRLLGRPTPLAAATMRVLGMRHLAQAAMTMLRPTSGMLTVGAASDGLHASTALALAAINRRQRRIALVDTAIATVWIALDLHAARPRPATGRRCGAGARPARSRYRRGRRAARSLAWIGGDR